MAKDKAAAAAAQTAAALSLEIRVCLGRLASSSKGANEYLCTTVRGPYLPDKVGNTALILETASCMRTGSRSKGLQRTCFTAVFWKDGEVSRSPPCLQPAPGTYFPYFRSVYSVTLSFFVQCLGPVVFKVVALAPGLAEACLRYPCPATFQAASDYLLKEARLMLMPAVGRGIAELLGVLPLVNKLGMQHRITYEQFDCMLEWSRCPPCGGSSPDSWGIPSLAGLVTVMRYAGKSLRGQLDGLAGQVSQSPYGTHTGHPLVWWQQAGQAAEGQGQRP